MGIEVKPLGVKCNIQCQYCYQNPIRDAGGLPRRYDLEKIKAAIEAEGSSFSLFGGEPLLMPKVDLEELWAWGLARFGKNSIQTNGTLIDDDHIRLFKRYRVSVGLSLDGPGALNDARWCGTLDKTRETTAKAERILVRLCEEGLCPSLIVTLHRANASFTRLPALLEWIRSLDHLKIRHVRLHLLEHESNDIRAKYGLDSDENIHALLSLLLLEDSLAHVRFDLFRDMKSLLMGVDHDVVCIWGACDPYATQAVQGIEGNGQRSNCDRTNKDGVEYVKADAAGFERYLALIHTPQEHGGCQGCRFFVMCKGQCPGTALLGDWRNRSEHCAVWFAIFEVLEARMIAEGHTPLSISARRGAVERRFIDAWSQGSNMSIFLGIG